MKWKKMKGEIINDFMIIDSYKSLSKNGKPTWKIELQCQRCGNNFVKAASVDINNVKCKCMVKSNQKKTGARIPTYIYQGNEYTLKELETISGVKKQTIYRRIKAGKTVDDALINNTVHICVICGKEFKSKQNREINCCGRNCRNRKNKGKGAINPEWKELKKYRCEICGNKFQSYHLKARFCSDKCRKSASRLERRNKFRELKKQGKFDISVTLDKVYERFNGICCYCNKQLFFSNNPLDLNYPIIDHIQPISKGGSHTWNNVQLLCKHCNDVKGAENG